MARVTDLSVSSTEAADFVVEPVLNSGHALYSSLGAITPDVVAPLYSSGLIYPHHGHHLGDDGIPIRDLLGNISLAPNDSPFLVVSEGVVYASPIELDPSHRGEDHATLHREFWLTLESSQGKEYLYVSGSRASGALEVAKTVQETLQELGNFMLLEEDWDTYGGSPPYSQAIKAAQQFIQDLVQNYGGLAGTHTRPFHMAPVPTGGVQLIWRGSRRQIDLEFGPSGEISYLVMQGTEEKRRFNEQHNVSRSEALKEVGETVIAA